MESIDDRAALRTRPAEPSDDHFMIQLSREVFHIYGPYERIMESWLKSGLAECLIGSFREKAVAFAMMSNLPFEVNPAHVSELLALAVVPERQGTGIGGILLKEMEKKAAAMNIKGLFLHTALDNTVARRLFKRNGYQARGTKRSYYPAGQDAIFMSKQLGAKAMETPGSQGMKW
ncbi:MAG: GNAT family N-acetyltransferase [Deltaproteobacteria bacterium]|nr:GNAT family N-acetyltransferase [Deltaproteobacteria bacterium]